MKLENTQTLWGCLESLDASVPLRASTVGALVLVLVGQVLKPGRHLLFGLHQDVQQIFSDVAVLIIKEGCGQSWKQINISNRVPGKNEKWKIFPKMKELTKISNTSCTTDAMDVFLNVTRQVKIDNVFHVGDVKATCSHLSRQKHNQLNKAWGKPQASSELTNSTHSGGNHDRAAPRTKLAEGFLTIALRAVTMDTGAGIAFAVEEVLKSVSTLLSLHKHQCERILAYKRQE